MTVLGAFLGKKEGSCLWIALVRSPVIWYNNHTKKWKCEDGNVL